MQYIAKQIFKLVPDSKKTKKCNTLQNIKIFAKNKVVQIWIKTVRARARQNGVRLTPKFEKVLEILARTPVPLSSSQIAAKALQIDPSTIFRILQKLQKLGEISAFQNRFFPRQKDKKKDLSPHFLACETCGRFEEIDLHFRSEIKTDLRTQKNFALARTEVIFWGKCGTCGEKDKNTSQPQKELPKGHLR